MNLDDRQPINIPIVPADAALPQIDTIEEVKQQLHDIDQRLIAELSAQIERYKGIVDLQNKITANLESRVNDLEQTLRIHGIQ